MEPAIEMLKLLSNQVIQDAPEVKVGMASEQYLLQEDRNIFKAVLDHVGGEAFPIPIGEQHVGSLAAEEEIYSVKS